MRFDALLSGPCGAVAKLLTEPDHHVVSTVPLPRTKATHERWKNRVSYQHQAFQVDLTQVKAADSVSPAVPVLTRSIEAVLSCIVDAHCRRRRCTSSRSSSATCPF